MQTVFPERKPIDHLSAMQNKIKFNTTFIFGNIVTLTMLYQYKLSLSYILYAPPSLPPYQYPKTPTKTIQNIIARYNKRFGMARRQRNILHSFRGPNSRRYLRRNRVSMCQQKRGWAGKGNPSNRTVEHGNHTILQSPLITTFYPFGFSLLCFSSIEISMHSIILFWICHFFLIILYNLIPSRGGTFWMFFEFRNNISFCDSNCIISTEIILNYNVYFI